MKRLILILLALILVGCAEEKAEDPSVTVQKYLEARVASDADAMTSLSCADWEAFAVRDADSFRSMDAKLEGLACKQVGEDGDYSVVECEGKIVTTYDGESREWPIGAYQLSQEDGEWKICGER